MHGNSIDGTASTVAQELLQPLDPSTIRHGGTDEFCTTCEGFYILFPECCCGGRIDVRLSSIIGLVEAISRSANDRLQKQAVDAPKQMPGTGCDGCVGGIGPPIGIVAPAVVQEKY